MPVMDVMDAVVGVMEDEGVDVVFGVPGRPYCRCTRL
jgi:thiamine pyrophosphate-dependent acetolactate synthase large subunit-like protein